MKPNVEINNNADNSSPSEPSKNIEDYAEHFALSSKNKGCCKTIRKKVTLLAFLVHEFNSAWREEDINAFKQILIRATDYLKKESGLTDVELSISYAYDDVPVQLKYLRDEPHNTIVRVLKQYGYESLVSYQNHYKKKFSKDEVPIVFVFNRDFRSYAVNDSSDSENSNGEEFSFVSYSGDDDDCLKTLLHEVFHQFGAIDYYLPEQVKTVATKLFSDSVMLHGMVIDELTRYIIGWDENPDPKVFEFLEATKNITEEDVEKARKENKKYDW